MNSKLYYDPVDEPAPGNTVLVTSVRDKRQKFHGPSVESCLRSVLESFGQSEEDVIFRRVREDDFLAEFYVWGVAVPAGKVRNRANAPSRLLGCYHLISSFHRTIVTSPEIATRYGILELYLQSDQNGDNCSYLDRTGKVRPLGIILPGDAIEAPDIDEAFVREEIEAVIVDTMEPIYPHSR